MTQTLTGPGQELIDRAKQNVAAARDQLLTTFSFVPDDKLNWSPSPSARTPLQIAAHCGSATATFAGLLRGEPWPLAPTAAEAAAQIRERDAKGCTREEAIQSIDASSKSLLAALEQATPEILGSTIWTAFGEFPYAFAVTFPAEHISGHARQIDYLQTIWGDIQDHH
ncbi:hypothetical protein CCAX7_21490 [Capsulimonas corticalis]|uniref:Uncharacterized protein n=1 Tax=Capsulimonas corticalis TaxID=2219043 RepID=A0A402D216_9BACT|nr:DinB family protein [Capsulimonas corticalis]BDI30098.1 hypothetical protein CCAX7_21490 [Capsulimonas corticalis]